MKLTKTINAHDEKSWKKDVNSKPAQHLVDALDNNKHPDEWKELTVLASIEGCNDAEAWHWIVKDQDGSFWYLTAWCDFTGWDCQSDLKYFGPYKSARGVIKEVPELDNDDRRPRELLEGQLHVQLFSDKMETEVLNDEN
jgi:hypothetical protein